jgi:putative intracellular protease/amidase
MSLTDTRVLVLAADLFEDSELLYPVLRLIEEGADVTTASPGGQRRSPGRRATAPSPWTPTIDDLSADDFKGLVIPGGFAPDALRRSEAVLDLVRAFDRAGKPIAFICHAGWVPISARHHRRPTRDQLLRHQGRHGQRRLRVGGRRGGRRRQPHLLPPPGRPRSRGSARRSRRSAVPSADAAGAAWLGCSGEVNETLITPATLRIPRARHPSPSTGAASHPLPARVTRSHGGRHEPYPAPTVGVLTRARSEPAPTA